MKISITRKLISTQISKLINKEISTKDFGEEMFDYLAFDDKYDYEKGFKELIISILEEFSEMHDAGKEHSGYEPHIPSKERLLEIIQSLNKV